MLGDEQVWLGEKEDEKQEGNLVEQKASPQKGLEPCPLLGGRRQHLDASLFSKLTWLPRRLKGGGR